MSDAVTKAIVLVKIQIKKAPLSGAFLKYKRERLFDNQFPCSSFTFFSNFNDINTRVKT